MIRIYEPEDKLQRTRDPRQVEGCWAVRDIMTMVLERHQLQPIEQQPTTIGLLLDALDCPEQPVFALTGA